MNVGIFTHEQIEKLHSNSLTYSSSVARTILSCRKETERKENVKDTSALHFRRSSLKCRRLSVKQTPVYALRLLEFVCIYRVQTQALCISDAVLWNIDDSVCNTVTFLCITATWIRLYLQRSIAWKEMTVYSKKTNVLWTQSKNTTDHHTPRG